jgi:gluconolactonase
MMRLLLFFSLAWACSAQEFTSLRIEKFATGYVFTDGPVWSRDGFLIFSEVPASQLLEWKPGAPAGIYRSHSDSAAGNAFDSEGRLYTCETHSRRVTRTDKKGKLEVLAERWQGKRLNAPNDIVVRRDGQAYFTDPAFGNQQDSRELDFYGVYHLSPHGELELIAHPRGRPNGIALSPNGRVLYVSNSDQHDIRAYDLNHSGAASAERVIVSGIDGVPDGMCVDERGNLYVAADKIEVYTPDGKSLGAIETPETPSNCAFGDADFGGLYITARSSVYHVRLNVKGSVQY